MKLSLLKSSSVLALMSLAGLAAAPALAQSDMLGGNPDYPSSGLGTTVNPNFRGGTLLIDQSNATYAQNFTVDGSQSNGIDPNGNTVTFTGNFIPVSGVSNLILAYDLSGGLIKASGSWGTAAAPMGSLTNAASFELLSGGSLTASNVSNYSVGVFAVDSGATVNGSLQFNTGQATNSGTWNGDLFNGGTVVNNGAWNGDVDENTVNGNITNSVGATWTGTLNNGWTVTNNGTWIGNASNVFPASGLYNYGAWTGTVANSGYFLNASGATVSGLVTQQQINGFVSELGLDGTLESVSATAFIWNSGTLDGGVLLNGGGFASNGTVNGGLTSNGASVTTYGGAINGAIVNNGGTFEVDGSLTSDSSFDNKAGSTLTIDVGSSYTVAGTLTNESSGGASGVIDIASGGTLAATLANSGQVDNQGTFNGNVVSNSGAVVNETGGVWNGDAADTAGGGTVVNHGTWNGVVDGGLTNDGTVNAGSGTITGAVANLAGGLFSVNAGASLTATSTATFDNQWGGQLDVSGTFVVAGQLSNAGLATVETGGSLGTGGVTNSGVIYIYTGATASGPVTNTGYIDNQGTFTGDITSDGATTDVGVDNYGTWNGNVVSNTGQSLHNNWGTWNGTVDNSAYIANMSGGVWNGDAVNHAAGSIANAGTWTGALTNSGYVINAGIWNGDASDATGGTILNAGTWNGVVDGGLINSGTVNAGSGTITGAISNVWGGVFSVNAGAGLTAASIATFDNQAGGVIDVSGSFTMAGRLTNEGGIVVENGGLFTDAAGLSNSGSIQVDSGGAWKGDVTIGARSSVENDGTWTGNAANSALGQLINTGTWTGTVNNAGYLWNKIGGTVSGDVGNTGSATNSGTITGAFNNSGTGAAANFGAVNGGVDNSGTATYGVAFANFGTINGGVTNSGSFGGNGTINGGVVNTGTFNTSGTVNGGLQNSGTVFASGAVNGAIVNSGAGVFTADGLTGDGGFTNSGTAVLDVTYGDFTGLTSLTNSSTAADGVTVTRALAVSGAVSNASGATIHVGNGGVLSAGSIGNSGAILVDAGGAVAASLTGAGTVDNFGAWTGTVSTGGAFSNESGGTVSGLFTQTAGTSVNAGALNGGAAVAGGATLYTGGSVSGGATNAGTLGLLNGSLDGAIVNQSGGVYFEQGGATTNGTVTNQSGGTFEVWGGYAVSGQVTNAGTMTVETGGTLTAASVANSGTLQIDQGGTLTDTLNNTSAVSNSGVYNADVVNSGAAAVLVNTSTGIWNGNLTNGTGASAGNSGQWNGTASNAGTFVNASGGTLSGRLTQTAGTATNAGTLNGGAAVSGGTLTSTGMINGGLSETGGTVSNAGTLNGGASLSGGTLNTTGTINGGLVVSGGTLTTTGAINGAISNSGTFTVTGALAGNGSAFGNTGTVAVGGNAFTGVGAFSNAAGATVSVGSATANGSLGVASLSNGGAITMQNGQAGDRINVGGAYTGAAGSTLALDVNLATGQSDRLTAGTVNGATTLSLQNVGGRRNYVSTPIVLVASGGGSGALTLAPDAQTQAVLSAHSLFDYHLQASSGGSGWGLVSTVNGAAASTLANHTALVLNTLGSDLHPAVQDLVAPSAGEGWSGHMWMHATYAGNRMKATTTSDDGYSAPVGTVTRLNADGLMAGAEAQKSGARTSLQLGVAGGWTEARASDSDGYASRFNVPSFGAYAVLSAPHLVVGAQAWHDDLSIRPDAAITDSTVHGHNDTLALSVSVPFTQGGFSLAPYADYRASSARINAFTVAGGSGRFSVLSPAGNTAGGGLRLSTQSVRNGTRIKPYIALGMETVSGHGEHSLFTPADGGAPVNLMTTGPGSYTRISAGVDAGFASGLQAYAHIDDRSGSKVNSLAVTAGVRKSF